MTLPPGLLIMGNGDIYGSNGKLLWESDNSRGYRTVRVRMPSRKWKTYSVHVLVCEEFHGPKPFPGAQVRHLDGNSRNNTAKNLCWGTKAENEADKTRHGTVATGERNGQSKLNAQIVREIRERHASGESQRSLAREYGVGATTVSQVVRRETWAHI